MIDDPQAKEAAVAFLLPGPLPAEESRETSPTLLPGPAPDPLIDDPRTKEAAVVAFVLPGPPSAPEVRDQALSNEVSANSKIAQRAPGEITAAELVQMLTARSRSTPRSATTTIELPFTDAKGNPTTPENSSSGETAATLPFTDSNREQTETAVPDGTL